MFKNPNTMESCLGPSLSISVPYYRCTGGFRWTLIRTPWCQNHTAYGWSFYTQRNLFEILLNQSEIRWYLPFPDWFRTKRMSVWFQINRKMVTTIWFRFDLTRFRKDFSVNKMISHTLYDFGIMESWSTSTWNPPYNGNMVPRFWK